MIVKFRFEGINGTYDDSLDHVNYGPCGFQLSAATTRLYSVIWRAMARHRRNTRGK